MGARVEVAARESREGGEAVADLTVSGGAVRGAEVGGALIPRLIDEVPALAVIACIASGTTVIRDAAELRVKESDRIRTIAAELGRMGGRVTERPDGLSIEGGRALTGAVVSSGGDHRMAMALVVAGLGARGETVVEDTECIATSFPGFVEAVNRLAGEAAVVAEP
jgi:3-phosphoshikimate 1-carboxyvinyltransferase